MDNELSEAIDAAREVEFSEEKYQPEEVEIAVQLERELTQAFSDIIFTDGECILDGCSSDTVAAALDNAVGQMKRMIDASKD